MLGVFNKESRWNVNVFSLDYNLSSNTADIQLKSIFKLSADLLRSDVLGTSKISTGAGALDLRGPSFSYRISNRLVVGLTTRARLHANYWEVDGRLVSEIGELTKVIHEYPYVLPRAENSKANITMFSELGAVAAYEFKSNEFHSWTIGGTLKYVNGIANTTLETAQLEGIIKSTPTQTSYLTDATGSVTARTSGNFFGDATFGNLVGFQRASIAADLGLTYAFRKSRNLPINFVLGISVTDIGKASYRADSSFSKSYDVHISPSQQLYFNNNFANSSFSQTTRVFDKYPRFFSRKAVDTGKYDISLPTMLRLQASYFGLRRLSLTSELAVSLNSGKNLNKLYPVNLISVTPTFHRDREISISLPISYQQYGGGNVGLMFRYRGFFIGSNSLVSAIVKSRQVNAYTGFCLDLN
ncbi:hypothetical protein Dfer_0050 [Dyadobacter fermentans DSM 18053]|uniref:DUF5723 domain-containing protein n=2 Tax=Dyadobacter fermentans TaxID=94254 RepID=C6VUL3_DYAFD|nr:hypothetical protein Dfer_0050 [Dyadobacter fermentans DSM 18053]